MEITIPQPVRGLSDDHAFSVQPPETTGGAKNVRVLDCTNGRRRISQRFGMSKANSTAIVAAEKVAELASLIYDSRNVTYDFTAGNESVEWSNATPSGRDCLGGVVDDQGNVYAIDGHTALVKYNADGALVWRFALPAKGSFDIIRWVYVDDLLDVYCGISDGKRQSDSRIWKLSQLVDDEVEVAWEFAPNAHVEKGIVRNDKLYTLQNDSDRGFSYVRAYTALDATQPQLDLEFSVPYPANDFGINSASEVLVTCQRGDDYSGTAGLAIPFQRTEYPQFPKFGPAQERWTPYDLDEWQKRIWSWYVADDISEFDVDGDLSTGASVLRLPDRSGKERHFYADLLGGNTAPIYESEATPGHAGLRFRGSGGVAGPGGSGVGDAMVTRGNESVDKEYSERQKTAIPAYTGSMWCSVMAIRLDTDIGGTVPACVWSSENAQTAAATASGLDERLLVNRQGGITLPGTFGSGFLSWVTVVDSNDPGLSTQPRHQDFGYPGAPSNPNTQNTNRVAIVVQLHDGGIQPGGTPPQLGITRSMFNINAGYHNQNLANGQPDRFEGSAFETLKPTNLGRDIDGGTNFQFFKGELLEWIVLDRKDRDDDTTEPKILSHEQIPDETAPDATDELSYIMGYLGHKYGVPHALSHNGPATSSLRWPFIWGINQTLFIAHAPETPAMLSTSWHVARSEGILVKYSPSGDYITSAIDDPLGTVSGVGLGLVIDSNDDVITYGPSIGGFNFQLRKFIDQGSLLNHTAAAGGWEVYLGGDPTYNYARLAVDAFDNIYIGKVDGFSGVDELLVYKSDGTLLSDVALPNGVNFRGAAVDPRIPDYDGDLTDEMAEFVYVFTDNGGGMGILPSIPTVHRVRLVTASPVSGSPRTQILVGVSETGSIKTFTIGGGAPATPTGAAGKLSSSMEYFHGTVAFREYVMSDGVSPLCVYNPVDDEVTVLESTSGGSPPHRAKILETWQGRLVAARAVGLIDEAFNWSMSAIGDIRDWDKFPADRNAAAAIAGDNREGPGKCPDIVNGFIPYNDDIAFFLCDHSIWMLSGNPRDGGVFDLVSDQWGGAFGRAWAKDPEGNVYFFGSRGGLFKMPPGGLPQRITRGNIERRLQQVNLDTHYVKMAWNDRDEGLHIIVCPFGAPSGSLLKHWFWDSKNMGPWEDEYGTSSDTSVQPTCVVTVDGDDPDDRVVLFGCEDGYARKWDSTVNDDDGVATHAFIVYGPFAGPDVHREMRYVGPRVVLADDQGGATYDLLATDEAEIKGMPQANGSLQPGRNGMRRTRVKGSYCFLRIRNRTLGERFAIEEAALEVYPAGRKRVRQKVI